MAMTPSSKVDTCTGAVAKRVVSRLRECCRQVKAEVVSNSSNKIHQTWEALFLATPAEAEEEEMTGLLILPEGTGD